jgi:Uma2 family endonuclease
VTPTIILAMALDQPDIKTRRWTRVEYDRLIEYGVFNEDEHVELLDGLLVVGEPQGSRHSAALVAIQDVLRAAFGAGFHVRPQLPIALDDLSEPEPDAVVVRGKPWDYRRAHPTTPLLVVEIAVSSLAIDRRLKGALYARAGVTDYWVVNLRDEVVEVYRQPARTRGNRRGRKYRSIRLLRRGAWIAPLAMPKARIAVADLLPPR